MRKLQCAAALVAAVSLGGCGYLKTADVSTDTSYIEIMADEISIPSVPEFDLPSGLEALLSFADFADAGTFSSGEEGVYVGGVNAEQATAEAFDRGGAQNFTVEMLKSTNTERLILVNRLGLALGPAEDERLLLLFRQTGGPQDDIIPEGLWRVVQAGRQQRCRGANDNDWTPIPCS